MNAIKRSFKFHLGTNLVKLAQYITSIGLNYNVWEFYLEVSCCEELVGYCACDEVRITTRKHARGKTKKISFSKSFVGIFDSRLKIVNNIREIG